jgi:hypothetical protein
MNFLLYATGFGHTQIQSEISGGSLGKKVTKTYKQNLLFYEFFNLRNHLWSYPDTHSHRYLGIISASYGFLNFPQFVRKQWLSF